MTRMEIHAAVAVWSLGRYVPMAGSGHTSPFWKVAKRGDSNSGVHATLGMNLSYRGHPEYNARLPTPTHTKKGSEVGYFHFEYVRRVLDPSQLVDQKEPTASDAGSKPPWLCRWGMSHVGYVWP